MRPAITVILNNKVWIGLALVAFISGCGGSGGGANGGGGGNSGAPEAVLQYDESAANNFEFELPNESSLVAKIEPLAAGTAKLIAQQYCVLGENAPFKRLEYRIVTDANAEAAWVAFEKAQVTSLDDDSAVEDYSADVELASGKASIEFRIDPGLTKRYEVSGWEVTVP